MECVVYIAVFAILTGLGMAAFYFCWDHTKAMIYATDDIAAALRAGEHWRADVRAATGKISVETTAAGEVVRMPEPGKEIIYRFESGEMRREVSTLKNSQVLLPKVKSSQMTEDARGECECVALGIGIDRATPGNTFAAAVHLRISAAKTMKIQRNNFPAARMKAAWRRCCSSPCWPSC